MIARTDDMQPAGDGDRLIQEVLSELGWEADPKTIADHVRRLEIGLPAEDEFTAICIWLGKAHLVHKLDQHQAPLISRDTYQVPDLLAKFESTGPLLIEVKSKTKQTLSFTPDYLERLTAYATLVNMPLLIAWKHHGIWTLFEVRHLTKARKNFNIRFGDAMKENLLGVLAGDVAYKIAPGAGIRFRCRKEKLLATEEHDDTVTERWQMRIDDVGFTVADGKDANALDPDVKTLFTTWDLAEQQTHSDTHIELHFVADDDAGMMFGHMALTHLLNWTLPQGTAINWRHAIRRDAVVRNMTNFGRALERAQDQKVVRTILHQQPQSWPGFLPKKPSPPGRSVDQEGHAQHGRSGGHMTKQHTRAFGRADQLDAALGLDQIVGPKLASIIAFAANIEYHLERAIWVLEKIDPKGIRPETDAQPITELITMLEKHIASVTDDAACSMLENWCRAARSGFIIRHNIAHGISFRMENTLVFSRNPRWHGEVGKREFGDLWCEPHVLDLLRDSFATLLRIVATIAKDETPIAEIANPPALHAVREARSILGEFADRFYNPCFEKY